MSALEIAADICRQFEGFKPKPYPCPAGIPTIGIGSTHYENGKTVTYLDPPITKDRAEELLIWELRKCESASIRLCPILASSDNRRAAIIDFCFNLGPGRLKASTLRRRINQGDWETAKIELLKWVRGGGRILPGLVKRRQVETMLF